MKLPITLDVLRTLKGVGANVAIISKSDEFDEGEFQHLIDSMHVTSGGKQIMSSFN